MPAKIPNLVFLLFNRERGVQTNSSTINDFQKVAEEKAACSEMQEIHCKLPNSVRSTFLMSFSPDSTKVASTHGDHKIYVCDVKTGKLLHKLEGHPRTPWCLAFHPTSNDILASGCLGGEVRIWHLHGGSERWSTDHNTVITSLAFHPLDKVLVIATYNRIHFWDWNFSTPFASCKTGSDKEKVRYVKFNNLGNRLITGISNEVGNSRTAFGSTSSAEHHPRPSDSTPLAQRRSMISRLMNMYRNMDGNEPPSYRDRPGTLLSEDDMLSRARQYADATTLASQFIQQAQDQRQLASSLLEPNSFGFQGRSSSSSSSNSSSSSSTTSTSSSSSSNNSGNTLRNSDSREPLPSDVNEQFLMRAFWRTYHRLRSICSTLERRMQQLHRNAERQLNQMSSSNSNTTGLGSESSAASSGILQSELSSGNQNRSDFLIGILTHLQDSLRSITLPSSALQTQLHQLQWRMADILERLTNVSGYRARLSNLRQEILEVERTQRIQDLEVIRRRDLAHCLLLVEMSIQLTQQMQRILHADYRLAQMNITPSSQSGSVNSSSVASNQQTHPNTSTSSSRQSPHSHRSLYYYDMIRGTLPEIQPQSANLNNSGFTGALRAGTSNLNHPSTAMEEQMDETLAPESLFSSNNLLPGLLADVGSANFSELNNDSDVPNEVLHHYALSHVITENFSRPSTSSGVPRLSEVSTFSFLEGEDEDSFYPEESGALRGLRPFETSTPISSSRFHRTPRSNFYVPEVRIDPAPVSNDAEPLPVQGRPRSPPLPTILSASNDYLLSSWFQSVHDPGRQPLFGSHEYIANSFHRIQSWDFSKCAIPVINDSKSNIVVPKCKIHNDASVDISKDGQLLVALVPSSTSGLESLTFAVYSLRLKSLGQCLYTWAFDSNAISVSFSPLSQYVVVGLATPRMYLSSTEKEAVAQIFQLKTYGKHYIATHVRSLAKQSSLANHFSQVSLNSVQWLPQPGQGLIYGTNRGCLCICKPVSPMTEKSNNKNNRLTHDYNLSLGMRSRTPYSATYGAALLHSLSNSARNLMRQTRSTGTQTFRSGRSSNASR